MSKIEYNFLLLEISKRLDHLAVLEQLIFSCREMLASGSNGHDSIRDTLSLFKQLEESKWLGINRLQVLKDLLKGVKEWYLFGKVKHFEIARKEYNELIERIIRALDELSDVERLIAFCRMEVPEFANESNIQDARSLFKELENLNCLGIDCFGVLKEILTKTEQGELLREVQVMEKRRNRKDDFETRKAQVAAFMSSVGNRLTGEKRTTARTTTTPTQMPLNVQGNLTSAKGYTKNHHLQNVQNSGKEHQQHPQNNITPITCSK